jgi:hypothetical protein
MVMTMRFQILDFIGLVFGFEIAKKPLGYFGSYKLINILKICDLKKDEKWGRIRILRLRKIRDLLLLKNYIMETLCGGRNFSGSAQASRVDRIKISCLFWLLFVVRIKISCLFWLLFVVSPRGF